eukprot:scaffold3108_cov102-Skeletonema_dohrnii-CCMP3373.AAC.13
MNPPVQAYPDASILTFFVGAPDIVGSAHYRSRFWGKHFRSTSMYDYGTLGYVRKCFCRSSKYCSTHASRLKTTIYMYPNEQLKNRTGPAASHINHTLQRHYYHLHIVLSLRGLAGCTMSATAPVVEPSPPSECHEKLEVISNAQLHPTYLVP